jgi:hypothetical protein
MKMLLVMALATSSVLGTASAQTPANAASASPFAIANPNVVPGTTAVAGHVTNVQVGPDGSFSFALIGNPDICQSGNITNKRGAVVVGVSGVNDVGAERLYDAVRTAYRLGSTVTVYSYDSATTTGWGCPIYAVDLN